MFAALSDSGAVDYARSIRAAAYGLWSGKIDENSFLESITASVRRGFTRAWYEGAQVCGISREELTDEERVKLTNEIAIDSIAALKLMQFISDHSKARGRKFSVIESRISMWIGRYSTIQSMAMMFACQDIKLKWVIGYTKEHCRDCLRLNGRVYRSSVWKKYDLYPQKHTLECGGWRCACRFEPTNDPVTPGRPPSVSGWV